MMMKSKNNGVGKGKGGGGSGLPRHADLDKRLCITVPEAAEMLGISRNFAYQLVKKGKLPAIVFNTRKLIPSVALLKMLEKGIK